MIEKYEQEIREKNETIKEEEDKKFFLSDENEKINEELEKNKLERENLIKLKDQQFEQWNFEKDSVRKI